jgi:hypothetical protein
VYTPMCRGRGRASHLHQPGCQACAPFPCPTCTLSTLVGRTTGSQCAPHSGWSGDDQTVRHPSRLCRLARFGDGFDGLNLASIASVFSLPLFLPPLPSSTSSSARLSLTRSGISSSTTSLRNSWELVGATLVFWNDLFFESPLLHG